jgi:hypothetical protein
MSCTIVTAFYAIKSKFSKDKYLEWGKTFMKLESPIILFTEESLIPELKTLRENRPITFIPTPFEELDTWKLYKNKWIENHLIDPENSYHTAELYAIWAQKSFFVEKAIQSNYYNTKYFFWCDFGAFRNPNIDSKILKSFPQVKYFSNTKLLLQSVDNLTESEKVIKEDGIYGEKISREWNKIRLVGGLWGGSIKACLKWKEEYQKMLELYFEKGRFAGKDQMVMLSTYLNNPVLANIVKCTIYNIDNWFFLEYLLSDLNISYELNMSYSIDKTEINSDNIENDNYPIVSVNIMGGLGNQMFQIAAAYAYAKQNNGRLKIVRSKRFDDGRPLYWDSILKKFNKYLVDTLTNDLIQWHESEACKYCLLPDLTSKGLFINGYLQSPKYFDIDIDISSELKELFRPSESLIYNISNKYENLLKNKDRVIVVHARRTDYCKNQYMIDFHGPLSEEYYKNAIQKMCQTVNNPIFLLVGDDSQYWIDILEKIPEFDTGNIHILNNENEINTFVLLQQFYYYIMSNSTYIWWSVWLANAKRVIAPSKWFGPNGPKNYKDIYVPSWELI